MATTNYSLPTLENTALFDLVTDYNALSNAIDAALAQVAGTIPKETITEMQAQISDLESTTESQGRDITILQSDLQSANSNIGTLQTGLNAATQNINNIKQSFDDYGTFSTSYTQGTNIVNTATSNSIIYVMKNTSETILKVYGSFGTQSETTKVVIPGITYSDGTTVYGIKSNIKAINRTLTKGYLVQFAGVSFQDEGYTDYAIGNDGYIYFRPSSNAGKATALAGLYFLQVPIFLGDPIYTPSAPYANMGL